MKRIQSVDVMRVVAVVMVCTLHTHPFARMSQNSNPVWLSHLYDLIHLGISNLARFAVPFFFVISGYFWGSKIRGGSKPIAFSLSNIKRIFYIFLFWNLIYLFPYNKIDFHTEITEIPSLILQNTYTILHKPISLLLMQGTKDHLWFLVSLMFSMGICVVFIKFRTEKSLVVFALILYLIGVLASTQYLKTPIGVHIPYVDVHILNNSIGPFFSTVFFTAGYFLSGFKTNYKWLFYGFAVFTLGCIIQIFEIYTLWFFFGGSLGQEFGFGTLFLGIGIAMASLSDHPNLQNDFLRKIGQMVLGIYASHYIFVDILKRIPHSPAWEIGYIIAVFTFSVLFTYFLSKIKIIREFVM